MFSIFFDKLMMKNEIKELKVLKYIKKCYDNKKIDTQLANHLIVWFPIGHRPKNKNDL